VITCPEICLFINVSTKLNCLTDPSITVLTCATDEALLNGVNPVPDSYFIATSENVASRAAYYARMDGDSRWWVPTSTDASAIPLTMYLQVCK